jgi:DNA-binding transcriptional MerR regulator/methylmalonyl-CoA mutase cobalamin-binding subunit
VSDVRDERPLTISEVSTLLGVPIPTIRSWERRYGFAPPPRTPGKHRRYTPAEIEQLRELRDAITRGHPAREAVRLIRERACRRPPRAPELDRFLEAARRLDATGMRQALDAAAERLGVEAAIRDVALAAMRETGARWAAGRCDVAEEHAATQAVRSWLGRHAATTPPPPRRAPTLVLACGPNDLHSIGLEAFGVVLARRGFDVRLLGAMTPIPSLLAAVRASGAVGAVVTAQRRTNRRAAVAALAALAALPGVVAFYAGDAFATASSRKVVPGIYLGDDLVEAAAIVERALGRGRTRRGA